jgi:hypothetical protein
MVKITAAHLVEQRGRAGFVVMTKPAAEAHSALAPGPCEWRHAAHIKTAETYRPKTARDKIDEIIYHVHAMPRRAWPPFI